jgi:C4-dicarboxylate-specific signal transduction histidine kinase
MPNTVHKTSATIATVCAEEFQRTTLLDSIEDEPEWAWSALEQLASDSEPECHEAQTALASANQMTFLAQLWTSIAEINQPISAVVMNAEAALRLLRAQPADTETARRLLACIVKDGMRTGDLVDRTRALIKKAPPQKET